jgi:hypothetical protein
MTPTVYLVVASSVGYEGGEQAVAAYADEDAALQHATLANEWIKERGLFGKRSGKLHYQGGQQVATLMESCPYHEGFGLDSYHCWSYEVSGPLPLVRHVDEYLMEVRKL